MATNTIVGASTSINPQPQSRLLSIPGEAREIILKHALPVKMNLVLDPPVDSAVVTPRRALPESILDAAALLRVSKQIYQEAVPLLYAENIPTIINPAPYGVLDSHLPTKALASIKKLEVFIHSKLWELAWIWESLVHVLPSTTELVLNFRGCSQMLNLLGELMYRASRDQAFSLKLELHLDYSFNMMGFSQHTVTERLIQHALELSRLHAVMYGLKPVPQLKTITVKAFLPTAAQRVLADYQDDHLHWKFNKDGNRDTNIDRYLVWEEMATT